MGAILLNDVRVGEGSIIAAGALVAEKTVIPPRSLYLGVPARLKRELAESDQQFIRRHAVHYLEYKEVYLAQRRVPEVRGRVRGHFPGFFMPPALRNALNSPFTNHHWESTFV
jgi:hypothetical protein